MKNQKKWDIVLKEDLQSLDEVVVVGYGTQRKGNIATAVTTVKAGNVTKPSGSDCWRSFARAGSRFDGDR